MKSFVDYINGCYITEIASNLSVFRDQVRGLIDPIIEHWCLTKWAEDHPEHAIAINRDHWAGELKGFMKKIAKTHLKSGRKEKTLCDLIIHDAELNTPTEVAGIIRDKFNEYGLQKYIVNMSYKCAENIKDICKVMAMTAKDVEDYCDEPIG